MVFLFSFLHPVVIISFTFSYIFCFFTHSHTTSGHALKPLMMLVPDLLATSRAPSTVKGYLAYFHNWKDWAVKVKVSFCSASASHVSLFLTSLLQSGYSISSLIPPFIVLIFSIIHARSVTLAIVVLLKQFGRLQESSSSVFTRKRLPICPSHFQAIVVARHKGCLFCCLFAF